MLGGNEVCIFYRFLSPMPFVGLGGHHLNSIFIIDITSEMDKKGYCLLIFSLLCGGNRYLNRS